MTKQQSNHLGKVIALESAVILQDGISLTESNSQIRVISSTNVHALPRADDRERTPETQISTGTNKAKTPKGIDPSLEVGRAPRELASASASEGNNKNTVHSSIPLDSSRAHSEASHGKTPRSQSRNSLQPVGRLSSKSRGSPTEIKTSDVVEPKSSLQENISTNESKSPVGSQKSLETGQC